jgi:hypothetical protein
MKTKTTKRLNVKSLVLANPKADPNLIASARAAIKALRKQGFSGARYNLARRGTCQLIRLDTHKQEQRSLPTKYSA